MLEIHWMKNLLLIVIFFLPFSLFGQSGSFGGDLQLNASLFMRDSVIGAVNTPLYDNLLTGGESWLTLNYQNQNDGLSAGVRLDIFNNSNLFDPNGAYSAQGLGNFFIKKEIKKLAITGGYFYDQFGSGIIYRSFEDRGLGLDYATFGVKLEYKFNDQIIAKAFTGREKNLFATFSPVIKGFDVEGNFGQKLHWVPGYGIMNRTIDQNSMDLMVANINTYDDSMKFTPTYNVFAYTFYHTLNYKNWSWYAEVANKTHEATIGADGKLHDEKGNVEYTTLSYSKKGFGVTAIAKRTENFILRTSPNEILLRGVLNFIPPVSRQNTLRLPARYVPATQFLEEMAYEADMTFTPKKGYRIILNFSNIGSLSGTNWWQEYYGELNINKSKTTQIDLGGQYVKYDQAFYQNEPGSPVVKSITPFMNFTYKFSKTKSTEVQLQYQSTKQDFGSWLFVSAEYNMAPHWSFAFSDMYNVQPNTDKVSDGLNYYNLFAAYTAGANRFTLAYVKQVAGVNCSGGVCRYEPAFSGVRFAVTSSF